ncbi:MAG TPA: 2-hydroxy-3-oxopropionate reductase [Trebonia sp.]|jgi:2-hydroxy-3-oxopropionate reductase
MARIAFIGLGVMGRPMAINLVHAGHQVAAFSRRAASVEPVSAAGATAAASVAHAVRGADLVLTMLPDSPDVETVFTGPDGILACVAPGTLCIDLSTIEPMVARDIAAKARQRGARPLDAPVSGGEKGAIEGALSIMVGGEAEDYQAALPVLRAMGKTVVHVGPDGAGQMVKAANQILVAGTIGLLAESLTLLAAQHVELEPALQVLGGGLADSRVLQTKAPAMLARDFRPGFRVALHHKDLGIAMRSARQANLALPLSALVAELMASLVAQGNGALDHSALLLLTETLSGRTPAVSRA